MTRYEEPMTKGGMAVVVSFLIIALIALVSVWIPALKPFGVKLLETTVLIWFIVFMFGEAFKSFITWMSKY